MFDDKLGSACTCAQVTQFRVLPDLALGGSWLGWKSGGKYSWNHMVVKCVGNLSIMALTKLLNSIDSSA